MYDWNLVFSHTDHFTVLLLTLMPITKLYGSKAFLFVFLALYFKLDTMSQFQSKKLRDIFVEITV